ncbi:hypothetical protein [Streptomyces sp. NPDC051546]|uniref:hypothetical protein n=1 Tax=Streptomyces sp. NPDC051546 TaxID=3365655 RepID=UPI00378BB5FD
MDAIEGLQEVLVPPSSGGINVRWEDMVAAYGNGFPFDYMKFMSLYGIGEIEGMLAIFAPMASPDPFVRRAARLPEEVLALPEVNEWVDPRHAAIFNLADMMVWGDTTEADVLCWITKDEDPNKWPVAVYSHRGEWSVHDFGMSDFLLRLLKGEFERNPTSLSSLFGRGEAKYIRG